MAKVPDHPCSEEDQTCEAAVQSHPGGSHSSRSRAPCRRNNDSVGQSLATVWEAHQKALAAISTLEREIERLNCTRAHSRARSKSGDPCRPSGEGWKRRHCQVRFADESAPSQGQRLWLGGTTRVETKGSFLPARVAGDFGWRGGEDAYGARYYGLCPVDPMEGRDMWDPRLVGGTVSSAREGRCQETSQGGEGILQTSMTVVGIGFEGGHSSGSPCTALPLQKEVYAPSWLNLCMQGHSRDPKRKSGGTCQGPPALSGAKQSAC